MRTRTLPTAALLALAACGPVLFAELKLSSVEVTLPRYQFPAGQNTSTTITYDLGASVPVISKPNVDYDLRLTRMTLVLTSGPFSNFDSFDSVRISALPPAGSTLPPLVLVDYRNPHTTTGMTTVTATSSTDADLKPYLAAGKIAVLAEYTGTQLIPTVWYADVTAEFLVRIRVDYGAYL